MAMVANYLFKMWISVIAFKSVMPLHDFLLKIFFELFEVSHNAVKYTTLKKNVNKNFNKKTPQKKLDFRGSGGPPSRPAKVKDYSEIV